MLSGGVVWRNAAKMALAPSYMLKLATPVPMKNQYSTSVSIFAMLGALGSSSMSRTPFSHGRLTSRLGLAPLSGEHLQQQVRCMNRNARRPKRANHGKRPVSHARKREKQKSLKSRLYREKVFGFW